jgi:hypothetical protein
MPLGGIQMLTMSEFATTSRLQPGVAMDEGRIGEYGDGMERGGRFPPLTVFKDPEEGIGLLAPSLSSC